jgi:hypothetical protein
MPTDVDVDDFAAGDGFTDDTDALRRAIATGRHLRFSRGRTYVFSGVLQLQPGQIVWGNGAVLKRRNQVHTTTSTAIVKNQTKTIDVASAAGLVLGTDIALDTPGGYDPNPRTIVAISGNTVTVNLPFSIDAPGGADVHTTSNGIAVRDDCRVYDLIMDGNRANHTFGNWETTHELHMEGLRSLASGCTVRNASSEAIYLERDGITVTNCTVLNADGNGVHLAFSARAMLHGLRIVNVNLRPAVGHADGCIVLSAAVDGLTVKDCHLENGISGVASWDQRDNSNITIVGNTIVGCTQSALEGLSPGTDAPFHVVIANNRIYDSVAFYVKGYHGAATTVFPSHVVFAGNYLRNTRVEIGSARHVTVVGNQIEDSGTTAPQISVFDSRQVLVRGNSIAGGRHGVAVFGTSENVLVEGNTLTRQSEGAIFMPTAGLLNCQVLANHVTADDTSAAGYKGITVSGKEVARENVISISRGEAGILANSQSIVKDNVVRKGAATYSIRAPSGSSGVLIKDNEVTAPVSNGGGGANIESGTTLIPA